MLRLNIAVVASKQLAIYMASATLVCHFVINAQGQEGIPTDVGQGEYPPGLVGVTEIEEVTKSRVRALLDSIQSLEMRYSRGTDSIGGLMKEKMELAASVLEWNSVPEERLDYLQQGLTVALSAWQQVNEKQLAGMVGTDAEPQARAAVFKFRLLWLKERALQDASQGEAKQYASSSSELQSDSGNRQYPPGLVGVTDIKEVMKSRIQALQEAVEPLEARYRSGRDNIRVSLQTRIELVQSQLDSTEVAQERLDYLQQGLAAALSMWRQADERYRNGLETLQSESQARALVYTFRVMWLKEKGLQDAVQDGTKQHASSGLGIPGDLGEGQYPPGLVGGTDIKELMKSRIQALQESVTGLERHYQAGRGSIQDCLESQMELTVAQLDSTDVGQERLDYLQQGLSDALRVWNRANATLRAGISVRGPEAQALAAVFKFRAKWLEEKASQAGSDLSSFND